ncbi:MAG: hypothetical protein JSV49_12605 [Thermoplasmata archaeon]|nr:MAG: hypothetical protein JSV49_12605 [Thermoplasmata archaeon]
MQPCKSTAAFEAIPQDPQKLDLSSVESTLTSHGFEVIANAKVLLVVTKNEMEISIYPTGKILIKIDDKSVAEDMVSELESILM